MAYKCPAPGCGKDSRSPQGHPKCQGKMGTTKPTPSGDNLGFMLGRLKKRLRKLFKRRKFRIKKRIKKAVATERVVDRHHVQPPTSTKPEPLMGGNNVYATKRGTVEAAPSMSEAQIRDIVVAIDPDNEGRAGTHDGHLMTVHISADGERRYILRPDPNPPSADDTSEPAQGSLFEDLPPAPAKKNPPAKKAPAKKKPRNPKVKSEMDKAGGAKVTTNWVRGDTMDFIDFRAGEVESTDAARGLMGRISRGETDTGFKATRKQDVDTGSVTWVLEKE